MNFVGLTLHLHNETEKAIFVSDDGNIRHAVWLPLSQIEFIKQGNVNGPVTVEIPEWLATNKGLI